MLKFKIENLKIEIDEFIQAVLSQKETLLTQSGHSIAVSQPILGSDKTKRKIGTEKGKIILNLNPSKKSSTEKIKEENL